MSIRFLNLPRPGTRCLSITLTAIVIDAALLPPSATCSLQPLPTPVTNCGLPFMLTHSDGALHVTEDPAAELAGTAHVFTRSAYLRHFWAPLQRQWTVSFHFTMFDGSKPTPAETRPVCIDVAKSRGYPNSLQMGLIQTGAGTAIEPLASGYIHNALAAGTALLALTAIPGTAHAWLRRRRTARNLCVQCAYSRRGLTPEAPCPECGTPRAQPT